MKYENQMTLTIDAKSINESFARGVISSFCVQLNPTVEELGDIKTAVSEAVTNCIVHGYQSAQKGEIEIWAGIIDSTLTIKITDFGKGIANIDEALQPFFTTCRNGERSGMGFTVMQAFCDKMEVDSEVDRGTIVTLIKTIGNGKGEEC